MCFAAHQLAECAPLFRPTYLQKRAKPVGR
jgi:hypothetical protein